MRCKNELITCRNVATRNSYCDQHQVVERKELDVSSLKAAVDTVEEAMTPQQKAAATRLKNKAAKLEALKKEIDALDVADD